MVAILHLFPDTNLLVQCRPVDQLDWGVSKDFDEVHLIVSRPVQSEIDEHKNKGGDRLAKRARSASSLLREIILGGTDHRVVRETNPRVKLFIATKIKPNPLLADSLDYTRSDDQLVGTVHSFISQNPDVDARILTHDTGPMASAQMVGVAVSAIPDDWLLPPETSESDKRIKSLEAEIARLKRVEPEFRIACLHADGSDCDKLELEATYYEAMSDPEVTTLLGRLKERFPIATDFGPRERSEREARTVLNFWGRKKSSLLRQTRRLNPTARPTRNG
jgi:predicted ribonuclease YlaK